MTSPSSTLIRAISISMCAGEQPGVVFGRLSLQRAREDRFDLVRHQFDRVRFEDALVSRRRSHAD